MVAAAVTAMAADAPGQSRTHLLASSRGGRGLSDPVEVKSKVVGHKAVADCGVACRSKKTGDRNSSRQSYTTAMYEPDLMLQRGPLLIHYSRLMHVRVLQ
jgi:hypothetical protein